ncbi:MerR family transcriptional regulator [Deinococcus sp.]|uniref:MerR family transcriptional regulator n=1 Tax=Deinococcus sp. TaxID=47478 RepID=UPI003CC5A912
MARLHTSELTIQEAAQLAGVSPDALRYYERIGLLAPVARSPGGHRQYTDLDLSWVDFLVQCREAGMGIQAMKHLSALHRDPRATSAQLLVVFEAHLQQVETRLRRLAAHREILERKVAAYRKLEADQESIPRPHDPDKIAAQRSLREAFARPPEDV